MSEWYTLICRMEQGSDKTYAFKNIFSIASIHRCQFLGMEIEGGNFYFLTFFLPIEDNPNDARVAFKYWFSLWGDKDLEFISFERCESELSARGADWIFFALAVVLVPAYYLRDVAKEFWKKKRAENQ